MKEYTIFGEEATSSLVRFHAASLYTINWNLEMLYFSKEENYFRNVILKPLLIRLSIFRGGYQLKRGKGLVHH